MGGTSTDLSLVVGRRGPGRLRPPARRPAGGAAGARHRQHRRGRRLDRAGRCRRRAARRPGERRGRARAGLLWPGRRRGDRDRREPGARPARSGQFPGRAGAARSGRGGGGDRPDRRGARRRAHERGRRHSSGDQHRHGRRHPPGVGAARRRSARVRDPRLRRRRRAARHRDRAAARGGARGRAAPRRGALGLGHADLGSALRDRAHPSRRCQPARGGGAARGLRRSGGRGPTAAGRGVVRWPGAGPSLGGHALRRADLRGERRPRRRRLARARSPEPAGGRLPPPPRGALHLCAAGPGGGAGQRPGRGDRRPVGPAPGAGRGGAATGRAARRGAASISAAWTEVPVFDFEALAPGQAIAGPAIIESATTTVLLRPGDRGHATAQGWLDIAVAAP